MHSIIIIVPYFGNLPDNFPLWLKSAGFNPTVNWLFITDQETDSYEIPENVIIKKSDLRQTKSMFQNKFDFPISLETAYKLCDFRPAYGELYVKDIEGYVFWGYGDIDLVYGNIREFFTEDVLEANERIYVFGHLSIYKNNQKIKQLYRKKVENCLFYKDVLSSPSSYAFDEFGFMDLGGMHQFCLALNIKTYNKVQFANIKEKWRKLQCDFGGSPEQITYELRKRKVFFEFNNGRLIQHWDENGDQTKEICYLHLRSRRMDNNCITADRFYVYPGEYTNQKKKVFLTVGLNPKYVRSRINRLIYWMKNPKYILFRIKEIRSSR